MHERSGAGPDSDGVASTVAFLRELGADRRGHSRRTLLDHLVGVEAILRRWGAPEHVCLAGLTHSIYGTEYFGEALLGAADRPRVRARVGEAAERLAHLFCTMRRASLYAALATGEPHELETRGGERLGVSAAELGALVMLVWANALEQLPYSADAVDPARARSSLARVASRLTERARAELEAAFAGPARVRPSVRALFDLEDVAAFLDHHWPHRMFVADGPVQRLAGLVSYDFEELVRMRKGYTRAFFRDVDGGKRDLLVAPGQERELYNAGFTVYFHGLHAPGIAEWVQAIDEELALIPGGTRVSAFASRKGAGLKAHYDMNDNFVCQAQGTKRWRIAPNEHVRNPTVGYTVGSTPTAAQAAEAPHGFPDAMPEPFQIIDMRPGTVMFMPRGMWHDTETVDEASLHFNIQSGLVTWKETLEFLITTPLLHAEELRGTVMGLFEGEAIAPAVVREMAEKLRHLADELAASQPQLHKAAFRRFIAARRANH